MKIILAILTAAFCLLPSAFAQSDDFARAIYFGRKFFDLRDYPSAYEQFAKANALQPDQAGLLYDMALTLAKSGRFSEAQGKVDRYNQLYPNGAEKPLVQKLQLELDFQRELEKKRHADEEYAELFARGKFLYAKNDLDAALKLFQQAEQQRPSDPAAVFDQARIYEKLGDLAKASERYKRYQEIESDPARKGETDQRILALDGTIDDMRTKIVCTFCGCRLPAGAIWCPRCWHGPYLTSPAVCSTATRAMFYQDNRFARNDTLPCLTTSVRYTPARQKAIQDARKAEGWRYDGEIIQGLGDQIRFEQGREYLEKAVDLASGDILKYDAHKTAEGAWLLDREDLLIDGQKYTSRYTFDANNRMVRQQVEYQNAAACGHVIDMTADYAYQNDAVAGVKIHGGYQGYVVEGSPRVDWDAAVAYTYDGGRVAKEDLAFSGMAKTYDAKPYGAARDEVSMLYPTMRVRRPLDLMLRNGDLCAMSGQFVLHNDVDLRPFYAMSPALAMLVPAGVTHAVVTFTY